VNHYLKAGLIALAAVAIAARIPAVAAVVFGSK
jgi:hypothetical protein